MVVVLAVAALAVAGSVTVVTRTTNAQAAVGPLAAAVEDEGADCAVSGLPDLGSLPTNAKLPDPFKKLDGTRITTKSDWRCRREEIKKLAEKFVYGEKPAKPASVTGTVSSTSITVNVTHNGRSSSFSARRRSCRAAPDPSRPSSSSADSARTRPPSGPPAPPSSATTRYAVGREGTPRNNKQGAFYSIYGSSSSTGLLAAWGWGVSRIIDVIEQSGGSILKADAMGVTGCSRLRQGRLRDRCVRPAHRPDHADRVGQRRRPHLPRASPARARRA